MSCGVGCRHGLDLVWLWLWCRPMATALITLLAWEPPHAMGAALEKGKKTKRQKKKKELPYNPAIPFLGTYPDKIFIQKNTCTPMFIAALFTVTKTWRQPKCPLTDEWIRRCGTYMQ